MADRNYMHVWVCICVCTLCVQHVVFLNSFFYNSRDFEPRRHSNSGKLYRKTENLKRLSDVLLSFAKSEGSRFRLLLAS